MIIVTGYIYIFVDCTYIEILTEHASLIYWDHVNTATGRIYIFFNFRALRQPQGVWVYIYINMTIFILPLGVLLR